jgi:hypothetical protein
MFSLFMTVYDQFKATSARGCGTSTAVQVPPPKMDFAALNIDTDIIVLQALQNSGNATVPPILSLAEETVPHY